METSVSDGIGGSQEDWLSGTLSFESPSVSIWETDPGELWTWVWGELSLHNDTVCPQSKKKAKGWTYAFIQLTLFSQGWFLPNNTPTCHQGGDIWASGLGDWAYGILENIPLSKKTWTYLEAKRWPWELPSSNICNVQLLAKSYICLLQ